MLANKGQIKQLKEILPKHSGRDNAGHVSVRHQGGRQKRYYRFIDFYRSKKMPARVISIEYDPNRNTDIALVLYADGEKTYIVAPLGLSVGDVINAEIG